MLANLLDRHIIVTGGAGTLGTSTVRLLLDSGANCSVPCFNEEELDQFELKDEENVWCASGIDLTDEQQTQKFYELAVEKQGTLWGSVHIAGGFGMGKIENTDRDSFLKQIHLNTVTCYNSCRTAIHWLRNSEHRGGRIVNIASRPALEPRQGSGMSAYTASKAGVAALTESLAAEVVNDNILVNAVAPSIIDTPANRNAMPDSDFDKWPKPEEIATQILFLVSPQNQVTRGGVIPVYGKF